MEIRELAETTEKEMGRGFAWLKKKPLLAVGVLAVAGGVIYLATRRSVAKPEMVGFAGYPQTPEVRYPQTPEREAGLFDERLRDLTEKIGRMGELQTEKIGRMSELQIEATRQKIEMIRQTQRQFEEQKIRSEQNLFRTITQAMRDHTPIQPPTVSEPRPTPTPLPWSPPTPLPLHPQYYSIPVTAVVGGTGGGLFIGERQAVKEFIETGGGGREVGVGHWSVDYRNWYPAGARPSSEVRQIVTGLAGKSQAEKLRILREEGLIRY